MPKSRGEHQRGGRRAWQRVSNSNHKASTRRPTDDLCCEVTRQVKPLPRRYRTVLLFLKDSSGHFFFSAIRRAKKAKERLACTCPSASVHRSHSTPLSPSLRSCRHDDQVTRAPSGCNRQATESKSALVCQCACVSSGSFSFFWCRHVRIAELAHHHSSSSRNEGGTILLRQECPPRQRSTLIDTHTHSH